MKASDHKNQIKNYLKHITKSLNDILVFYDLAQLYSIYFSSQYFIFIRITDIIILIFYKISQ